MRKLIVAAVLAALVSAPAALAKERNVQLLGAPATPKAGQAWTATISVKVDGKLVPTPGRAPVVRIISGAGRAIAIAAQSTTKAGLYRARVVFPSAGMWRVLVVDKETGRSYEFGRMRVRAA
jgi:hypothetical protein